MSTHVAHLMAQKSRLETAIHNIDTRIRLESIRDRVMLPIVDTDFYDDGCTPAQAVELLISGDAG